ncbi:MAG: gamma-D-glutamyl-meso-diaminopimelate peptidase [Alphaproteobacteria bacterium]|nr:gamma-D-glutamyl-meso-diaminopimelate peptidase [Alphaproteobacteria bacterium]
MNALVQANNLKPPYGVQVGQKLILPGVAAPEIAVASAKPVIERSKPDARPLAVKAAPVVAPLAEPISNATVASAPRGSVHAVALSSPEPTTAGTTLRVEPMKAQALAPAKAEAFKPPVVPAEVHKAVEKPVAAVASSGRQVLKLPANFKAEVSTPAPVPAAAPTAPSPERHVLRLPPGMAKQAAADPESEVATRSMSPRASLGEPPPRSGRSFQWPVRGKLISSYGPQPGGLRNDGLNIAARHGDKVVAADNGVVAYAGDDLKGFGNLVLIKHAGGFVTTYAHNDKLLVKRGDKVKRGQVIATVGESGAVARPQVHFQVRQGAHAVDPRPLMERS